VLANINLVWRTPNAEKLILKMARVSSPDPDNKNTSLINYLIKHKHWSPFEMTNMCVEITTSRAIAPQLLRHKSFTFQEFSQRYAEATDFEFTSPRRQDLNNRQNSINDLDEDTIEWWNQAQAIIQLNAKQTYKYALSLGIAKECARMLLPMSTQTKLYMNGTLRSWIHYFELRCSEATQLEHRQIALQARNIFTKEFPVISKALENSSL